ncbi:MAG: ribonuclease III [Prevotella sp.]|nr:ribonuclease III [Prevotella sp.]
MRLSDIIDRMKLPFRKEKELFSSLYQIMGFYPHNIEHYKVALIHKSSRQRTDKGKPLNNERLEFLGDAMLDAVVGHIVYEHFTQKREGFLTNTRSKLVSRDSLGKLAQEMGLTQLIQSNGEQRSHNSYMAGNAFEALVGAIYLDQGYEAVMRFMKKRILKQMVNIDKVAYKEVNFKSKLLEWTQKNRVRMDYRMLKQTQDDKGSPIFGFQVMIEGVEGGKGQGYSKKEAQQLASKDTLERLRREPQFIDAIFASKSERTKMEEEPTMAAPDLEAEKTAFIIEQDEKPQPAASEPKAKPAKKPAKEQAQDDEFDLSDISHNASGPSREDIIAAAEAAAFND